MIEALSLEVDSHLDLACGRGGDIAKWADCKIRRVLGIDIAESEVEEARYRLGLYARKAQGPDRVYRFAASPDIGVRKLVWHELASEFSPTHQFSSVSCQFAAHYFFKTEQTLQMYLLNASTSVRNRGCVGPKGGAAGAHHVIWTG